MGMSPRLLRPRASGAFDPAAQVYFNAVAQADGQQLETAVKKSINDFIRGCKADGIWDAIKASCILMGARTLSGALTPLVGTAPTNVGPFVSGDYNRKTGITGGVGKYIDTNRNRQDDPQDNSHAAVYISAASTSGFGRVLGVGSGTGQSRILRSSNTTDSIFGHGTTNDETVNTGGLLAFAGISRSSSSAYAYRINSVAGTATRASQTRPNLTWYVLNANPITTNFNAGSVSFYSLGEGINLALLDTRVSALVASIGAAI